MHALPLWFHPGFEVDRWPCQKQHVLERPMPKAWHTPCVPCPVDYHSSLFSLCPSPTGPIPLYVPQTATGHEYPKFVKIVEVGPRDGLQNEKVDTTPSHESHFHASSLCISIHNRTGGEIQIVSGFFIRKSIQNIWAVVHNWQGHMFHISFEI